MNNIPADKTEQRAQEQFRQRYNEIINRQLTVENINSYADDALEDLIQLSDDAIASRRNDWAVEPETSSKEQEDRAFAYYGLGDISSTLDHIINIRDDLTHIDEIIEQSERTPRPHVILSPDPIPTNIQPGAGTFEQKRVEPRTKTVLFVLEQDYEVDLDDPKQFSTTPGVLSKNMMRKVSYNMIELPELERIILVCDEEGNATFVLDKAALQEKSITATELGEQLTKKDLEALIADYPQFGSRLVYSRNFVTNIKKLIEDPTTKKVYEHHNDQTEAVDSEIDNRYLKPKAEKPPEGVVSVNKFAQESGTTWGALHAWLQKNSELVGEVQTYQFGIRKGRGLNSEQQEIIRNNMEFTKPPEGVISVRKFAKGLGMDRSTLQKWLQKNPELIGDIKTYNFYGKNGQGLSPEQQEIVHNNMEHPPKPPEGVISIKKFAKELGTSQMTLQKWLQKNPELIGDIKMYNFYRNGQGLDPDQQQIIRDNIELAPESPEEVMSVNQFGKKLGVKPLTLQKWFQKNPELVGRIKTYQFKTTAGQGLDPEQQAIIQAHRHEIGRGAGG
ncbi:MAG: hypothetical protein LBQ02_01255 [Candidatus Nomurabacteria bacterium]|jgi:DNA-binding transcriptional regulator YiaG|nr:hypothetical protein [Candidatus Nomurabacteria bacterium]